MARSTSRPFRSRNNIREDVVRIDHAINSKYQLMGHYLHDTLTQNYLPATVGRQHLSDCRHGHDQSFLYGGHQTDPDLFTQPAERNRLPLQRQQNHPHADRRRRQVPSSCPAGGRQPASSRLQTTPVSDMPEIDLQGSPLNVTWSPSLLSLEERLRRLRVSRRSLLDQRPAPI